MNRLHLLLTLVLTSMAILAAPVQASGKPPAIPIVNNFVYPDPGFEDGSHWVEKIEFANGNEVFIDRGLVVPQAPDGMAFWLLPWYERAEWLGVYQQEALAARAWTDAYTYELQKKAAAKQRKAEQPAVAAHVEQAPEPCPPAQDRTPTGVGKSLPFCAGEPVVGFRITLADGRQCTECYLPKAPTKGIVDDGVVKPWPTEIGNSTVWSP